MYVWPQLFTPGARRGKSLHLLCRAAEPETSDIFFTIPVDAVTDPNIHMALNSATPVPAR